MLWKLREFLEKNLEQRIRLRDYFIRRDNQLKHSSIRQANFTEECSDSQYRHIHRTTYNMYFMEKHSFTEQNAKTLSFVHSLTDTDSINFFKSTQKHFAHTYIHDL